MKQIIKIDDKNYKVVDNKETIYNLDELEVELNNMYRQIDDIKELENYIKTLPINIQSMFIYPPYPDVIYLEELINKLKTL